MITLPQIGTMKRAVLDELKNIPQGITPKGMSEKMERDVSGCFTPLFRRGFVSRKQIALNTYRYFPIQYLQGGGVEYLTNNKIIEYIKNGYTTPKTIADNAKHSRGNICVRLLHLYRKGYLTRKKGDCKGKEYEYGISDKDFMLDDELGFLSRIKESKIFEKLDNSVMEYNRKTKKCPICSNDLLLIKKSTIKPFLFYEHIDGDCDYGESV